MKETKKEDFAVTIFNNDFCQRLFTKFCVDFVCILLIYIQGKNVT